MSQSQTAIVLSVPQAWRACFGPDLPLPDIGFMMRLHCSGELRMWRNVPIWELMQTVFDNFYGNPED